MTSTLEQHRKLAMQPKAKALWPERKCELCGKPLGEESVSASDGTNEPVRICEECAGGDNR